MRVAIVGAGLAGLAAGCELAEQGHDVLLLERRPWAGGKTYSFAERDTGEHVDNGQHIAMRCTTEYVRFLERIGTAHLVRWQPRMSVRVYDACGRASTLHADPLPAGLHMLPSFATYRHLRVADKLRVARGIVAVRGIPLPRPLSTLWRGERATDGHGRNNDERAMADGGGDATWSPVPVHPTLCDDGHGPGPGGPASAPIADGNTLSERHPASEGCHPERSEGSLRARDGRSFTPARTDHRPATDDQPPDTQTFGAWLRAHGQTDTTIREFWDLIVVPALNCRCDDASAAQALFVFREGFLKSPTSAAIGVPAAGLTQLHVEPALAYVRARGGRLRTGATVARVVVEHGGVRALDLADGERIECDAVVAAVPPAALLSMLPPDVVRRAPFAGLASIRTSPIVNVHLWFDRPVANFDFAAFTGSDLQWVFNRTRIAGDRAAREEHLVISLSAAERYMALDKQELQDLLLPQLRRALPAAAGARVVRCAVIKERDATFVPAPGLRRPGARTPIANLFLAGAYTDTGWPATMESAVRGGLAAARAACEDQPHITQITGRPMMPVATG